MRKISATYIFPVHQPPLKNGILLCEKDGTIKDVIDTGGNLREQAGLEYYSGILVPGFVNAHCHLELSHLKGKIAERTGLPGFLGELSNLRNSLENDDVELYAADSKMIHNGTVAVGDISNSSGTLKVKSESKLYYHTFAESFGFQPSRAEKAFRIAEQVEELFLQAGLPISVTPHAAYSVSEPLFLKLRAKAQTTGAILSVHNQESRDEEEFFSGSGGPILHHLHHNLGLDVSHWSSGKGNGLNKILTYIPPENQLLLVHNTYTTREDIQGILQHRKLENTFFVLCPNSNLYIEDALPPVAMFRQEDLNLCIGTDSLASNHQLSVVQEMITLQKYYPEISLQNLIQWATLNGARALQADHIFGSFEKGKKPGINLITGVDLHQLKLKETSRVKVL